MKPRNSDTFLFLRTFLNYNYPLEQHNWSLAGLQLSRAECTEVARPHVGRHISLSDAFSDTLRCWLDPIMVSHDL